MDEDRLNVRYVSDINSIMPVAPRYNPDTRTYFKCSIYSPSNRLYTVNEEVNSTQSDVGGAAGEAGKAVTDYGKQQWGNYAAGAKEGIQGLGEAAELLPKTLGLPYRRPTFA